MSRDRSEASCCSPLSKATYFGAKYHVTFKLLWSLVLALSLLAFIWLAWREVEAFVQSDLILKRVKKIGSPSDPSLTIHFFNTNQIRKSFLLNIGIQEDSKEHEAFEVQFMNGHAKESLTADELRSFMKTKLKLIRKEMFNNFAFYFQAAHCCNDSIIPLTKDFKWSLNERDIGCQFQVTNQDHQLAFDLETFDTDHVTKRGSDFDGMYLMLSQDKDEEVSLFNNHRVHGRPGSVLQVRTDVIKDTFDTHDLFNLRLRPKACVASLEESGHLHFTKDFGSSACHKEELLNKILSQCKCIPKFGLEGQGLPNVGHCHGQGLLCADQIIINGTRTNHRCLPKCTHHDVTTTTQSLTFPTQFELMTSDVICPLIVKLIRTCLQPERKHHLELRHPKLCNHLTVANVSGRLCTNRQPSLKLAPDLAGSLYNYSRQNLVLVDFTSSMMSLEQVWSRDKSLEDLLWKLVILLVVCFGFNLLLVPDWILHCFRWLCCHRRSSRVKSDPEETTDDGT